MVLSLQCDRESLFENAATFNNKNTIKLFQPEFTVSILHAHPMNQVIETFQAGGAQKTTQSIHAHEEGQKLRSESDLCLGDWDCETSASLEAMAVYSGVTPRHLAPVVHLLGIAGIVLMVVWTYSFRGGYGLSGTAVFNLHPLIMFAGFIFLSSEAIVVYKTVKGDKVYQKAVHMTVQGVAIFLAVVGICAAYKFHLDNGIQNFYSLHSWFGLTTITLYVVQWILGFVAFWQQSVAKAKRAELLPWHVFVGLAAYAAALATAELGLLEKLTFLQKTGASPLGLWSSEAMLVNFIGIAILAYGAVVVLTTLVPNSRKEAGYRDLLE